MIRDRDGIYGTFFEQRVENMGIEEVLIAPKSPWQNPYCERVIGSIRRECLDHSIILSENHLCRILKDYMDYYNNCRTHLSLDRNSPSLRDVEPPSKGKAISIPQVGGLHHVYKRVAWFFTSVIGLWWNPIPVHYVKSAIPVAQKGCDGTPRRQFTPDLLRASGQDTVLMTDLRARMEFTVWTAADFACNS